MSPVLAFGFSDVGGGEIVIIGIVALLLFGKNLPTATRNIGKALAEFKRALNSASSEIKKEMDAAADGMDKVATDVKKEIAAGTSDPVPNTVETSVSRSTDISKDLPKPKNVQPAVSDAAQLDNLTRNIPPPSKIPPPIA
jgi:sec-independent protein translocase protein TatA